MKGKDDKNIDNHDLDDSLEIDKSNDVVESNSEQEIFNGEFDSVVEENEIPILRDIVELSDDNTSFEDFDFEDEIEMDIKEEFSFEEEIENDVKAEFVFEEEVIDSKKEDDIDFDVESENEDDFSFEEDFEIDIETNKEDIDFDVESNKEDEFSFEDELVESKEDFDIDTNKEEEFIFEDELVEPEKEEDTDFDVVLEKEDEFSFEDELVELNEEEEFDVETDQEDDFSFDDAVVESKEEEFEFDIETDNEEEFSFDDEVVISKDDDFGFDMETDKEDDFSFDDAVVESKEEEFEFDMETDKEEFSFDDEVVISKDDDFGFDMETDKEEFSFDDEVVISKDNDFEFEENEDTEEEFETSFDFEEDLVEDDTPRVLKDDLDSSEDNSDKDKPKNKLKLILGVTSVILLILGGYIGWKVVNDYDYIDEDLENQVTENVQQPSTDNNLDFDIPKKRKEVVKEVEKVKDIRSESPVYINNDINNDEKYNKLNGQFETVIKSISSMSSKISSIESENIRLKRLVSDLKVNNQSGNLDVIESDIGKFKKELSDINDKIDREKDFQKETMINFLEISKKLREEILVLKKSQVDKSDIEDKLSKIDEMNKQFEMLSNKVANNEVLNKLTNLEKEITANKLAEVEKQVVRNNKKVQETVKGKKSVLELLEEKNREKDLESNSTIVNENDYLRIPLSVTIADDYDKPKNNKKVAKKTVKNVYNFIGTIEGVVYLKNSSGSISEYRERDHLPGYGEILKIYRDGTIETEQGALNFK